MTTGPLNIKDPVSKWTAGPQELVDFMNNQYIPKFKNVTVADIKKRLIYQKRQYAGLPSQFMGVCEVLLLGMSHNRLVQSKESVHH